jgi:hypothetical protein
MLLIFLMAYSTREKDIRDTGKCVFGRIIMFKQKKMGQKIAMMYSSIRDSLNFNQLENKLFYRKGFVVKVLIHERLFIRPNEFLICII